jgi:hypothetical protein
MTVFTFEEAWHRMRRVRQIEAAVRLAIAALRDESLIPRRRIQTAEYFLTMFVHLDDTNHHERIDHD